MARVTVPRVLQLIDGDQLKLFGELCELVESEYKAISDPIYTDSEIRRRFYRISTDILRQLKRLPDSSDRGRAAGKLKEIIRRHSDGVDPNLLLLSTFKALGEYLLPNFLNRLKRLDSITAENILITERPANPIYDSAASPVRLVSGSSPEDITNIFKFIHIINTGKASKPTVSFIPIRQIKKTNNYLKRRIQETFRIAVTAFMPDMEFDIGVSREPWIGNADERTLFRFRKVANPDHAEEQLGKILDSCIRENVAVLVLPELMIDAGLIEFTRNRLRRENRKRVSASSGKEGLLLVVAGSFHQCEDENAQHGDEQVPHNVSTILDHRGNILWTHRKMERFSFSRRDIENIPEMASIFEEFKNDGHEGISVSDKLLCANTPLGRLAVCICIDFFHKDHAEAFRNSGANVFLVPAMTHKASRFRDTAQMLGSCGLASSFVANSGTMAEKNENGISSKGASFCYVPDTKIRHVDATCGQSRMLILSFRVNEKLIKFC